MALKEPKAAICNQSTDRLRTESSSSYKKQTQQLQYYIVVQAMISGLSLIVFENHLHVNKRDRMIVTIPASSFIGGSEPSYEATIVCLLLQQMLKLSPHTLSLFFPKYKNINKS